MVSRHCNHRYCNGKNCHTYQTLGPLYYSIPTAHTLILSYYTAALLSAKSVQPYFSPFSVSSFGPSSISISPSTSPFSLRAGDSRICIKLLGRAASPSKNPHLVLCSEKTECDSWRLREKRNRGVLSRQRPIV